MLNQKAVNEERECYRIVVAAGGITHPVLGAIPAQGCFPLPLTGTGTIFTDITGSSTAGKRVLGTNTLFLSEVQLHDYLADSGGRIRKVVRIYSDTQIELEAAFPVQLGAGTALKIVRKSEQKMIYAKSVGTVDATLNEQAFLVNETFLNGGAPVSYDVTTTSTKISFQIDV